MIDRDEQLLGFGEGTPKYLSAIELAIAQPRWIFDGTPFWAEDLVYPVVDTVVFLDYSRVLCVSRALRRSARVELTRQPRGAHKPVGIRGWLDPEHPVRWAWSSQAERRDQLGAQLTSDQRLTGATRVHLRHPSEAEVWLRGERRRLSGT